jgi:hypothetical protein
VVVRVEPVRRAAEQNAEIASLQERFFAREIENALEPRDLALGLTIRSGRDAYREDRGTDEDRNYGDDDEDLEQ